MLDTTTGLMHTSFHLILTTAYEVCITMSFLQIKKHRFREICSPAE